jgi:hypothetical protein
MEGFDFDGMYDADDVMDMEIEDISTGYVESLMDITLEAETISANIMQEAMVMEFVSYTEGLEEAKDAIVKFFQNMLDFFKNLGRKIKAFFENLMRKLTMSSKQCDKIVKKTKEAMKVEGFEAKLKKYVADKNLTTWYEKKYNLPLYNPVDASSYKTEDDIRGAIKNFETELAKNKKTFEIDKKASDTITKKHVDLSLNWVSVFNDSINFAKKTVNNQNVNIKKGIVSSEAGLKEAKSSKNDAEIKKYKTEIAVAKLAINFNNRILNERLSSTTMLNREAIRICKIAISASKKGTSEE